MLLKITSITALFAVTLCILSVWSSYDALSKSDIFDQLTPNPAMQVAQAGEDMKLAMKEGDL